MSKPTSSANDWAWRAWMRAKGKPDKRAVCEIRRAIKQESKGLALENAALKKKLAAVIAAVEAAKV